MECLRITERPLNKYKAIAEENTRSGDYKRFNTTVKWNLEKI